VSDEQYQPQGVLIDDERGASWVIGDSAGREVSTPNRVQNPLPGHPKRSL